MRYYTIDVAGFRVESSSDRGSTDIELIESVAGMTDALHVLPESQAIRHKFLAQPDRGSILQMGTSRLHDVIELLTLGGKRRRQAVKRRKQLLDQQERCHSH